MAKPNLVIKDKHDVEDIIHKFSFLVDKSIPRPIENTGLSTFDAIMKRRDSEKKIRQEIILTDVEVEEPVRQKDKQKIISRFIDAQKKRESETVIDVQPTDQTTPELKEDDEPFDFNNRSVSAASAPANIKRQSSITSGSESIFLPDFNASDREWRSYSEADMYKSNSSVSSENDKEFNDFKTTSREEILRRMREHSLRTRKDHIEDARKKRRQVRSRRAVAERIKTEQLQEEALNGGYADRLERSLDSILTRFEKNAIEEEDVISAGIL